MVIRKMKSFRKNMQKKVCIFLSKKWEKQVSTERAVSPGARSATERRKACKVTSEGKTFGCFDIVYRKE